jgi:protein-tyrosine-phosphatase
VSARFDRTATPEDFAVKKASKNHKPYQVKRNRYLIVSNDGCARGAMCYALLRQRLKARSSSETPEIRVSGLLAFPASQPDRWAAAVLRKRKLPSSGFRTLPLDEKLLGTADCLIACSEENWNYVRNLYGNIPGEVSVLHVPVILERSLAAYEKACHAIENALEKSVGSAKSR